MKMMKIKNFVVSIILLALCGYATWQGMQWLAIFAICLFLGVVYLDISKKIRNIVIEFIKNSQSAKIGEIELKSDRMVCDIPDEIINHSALTKTLLSNLSSSHIGLLIHLHNNGNRKKLYEYEKDLFRDLRAKGLVVHNAESMKKSNEIELTDLGLDIVKIIKSTESKMPNA